MVKRSRIFEEDRSGFAFREVFTPTREGPLGRWPSKPHPPGKGGPSINQTPPPPVLSPVNTAAPVASGTLTVGSTLSCTNGTWTNSPTGYAYQWLRNGANISGATSSTYVTVTADGGTSIRCTVTATNAHGSGSATSNTLAIAAGGASSVWSAADAAANAMTLSNGGLTVANPAGANMSIRGTISKTSGKLYIEFLGVVTADNMMFGLASSGFNIVSYLGSSNYSAGQNYSTNQVSSGFTSNYSTTQYPLSGDVWAMAVDFGAGSIWFGHNNVWLNSSNPATASLPMFSFVPATVGALFPAITFTATTGETWTLQPTPASQHYLPPPGFQAWDGGPVTPPASSVWSASDAAANAMTLSNGGLTVAATTSVWQSVRGTISHTSGKYYLEFLVSNTPSSNTTGIGIADASFVPTSYVGSSNYSGGSSNSGGVTLISPSGFVDNTSSGYNAVPTLNDVFQVAVDLTAGSFWYGKNNTWFASGNPVTGITPLFSIVSPALGLPFFPALSLNSSTSGVWTLQPTAASQHYLPPPGFQAWDGGPVTPAASSVWSAADASANAMTLSNGGLTFTGTITGNRSIRNSVSKTSGKLYVEFLANNTTGNVYIGLASAGFVASNNLGSSNYSGGIWPDGTNAVSTGFASLYTSTTYPANADVWALAVDFSAGYIWFSRNGVWVSPGNPATGVSPAMTFVPATVGALFAGVTTAGIGESWTLQPTAASQKYAPPSGFSPWG